MENQDNYGVVVPGADEDVFLWSRFEDAPARTEAYAVYQLVPGEIVQLKSGRWVEIIEINDTGTIKGYSSSSIFDVGFDEDLLVECKTSQVQAVYIKGQTKFLEEEI